MSEQTYVVEGAEFTAAEIQQLAAEMQTPGFALWSRVVERSQALVAEQGMGLTDISDRQLWECRGAYQELRRLASVRDGVLGLADMIAKERAAEAAAKSR